MEYLTYPPKLVAPGLPGMTPCIVFPPGPQAALPLTLVPSCFSHTRNLMSEASGQPSSAQHSATLPCTRHVCFPHLSSHPGVYRPPTLSRISPKPSASLLPVLRLYFDTSPRQPSSMILARLLHHSNTELSSSTFDSFSPLRSPN